MAAGNTVACRDVTDTIYNEINRPTRWLEPGSAIMKGIVIDLPRQQTAATYFLPYGVDVKLIVTPKLQSFKKMISLVPRKCAISGRWMWRVPMWVTELSTAESELELREVFIETSLDEPTWHIRGVDTGIPVSKRLYISEPEYVQLMLEEA